MAKTLFVIVKKIMWANNRKIESFWGGKLNYGYITMNNPPRPEYIEDIQPRSLSFTFQRKFTKVTQVPNINRFLSISKFRDKIDKRLDPKFSQKVLDALGFERIWIYDGNAPSEFVENTE